MTPEELLRNLQALLDSTPPAEAIAAFKGFKAASPREYHELLDAGWDLFVVGKLANPVGSLATPKAPERHIVVALVHGIRTTAGWQERARDALQVEGKVTVVPIGYGYLDVFRFLGPWRETAIRKVEQELRDLSRLHGDYDLVVMAHSFGTYIVSRILRQSPDIRIKRLLLCGSIIPADYRWDQLPSEFNKKNCVNEVGTRDIWPVFARVASFGYGSSGSVGFKTGRVWDRFFDYGHSDFFTQEHLDRYWRPFILTGQIVTSPWDSARPTPKWMLSLLSGVPMVKVIVLGAAAPPSYGLYWAGKQLVQLFI